MIKEVTKIPTVYEVWIDADRYRSLLTRVVGVSFGRRQKLIENLQPGDIIQLRPEPQNAYDKNAIAVWSDGGMIGHLNRSLAKSLAGAVKSLTAVVMRVGGDEGRMGCSILLVDERK